VLPSMLADVPGRGRYMYPFAGSRFSRVCDGLRRGDPLDLEVLASSDRGPAFSMSVSQASEVVQGTVWVWAVSNSVRCQRKPLGLLRTDSSPAGAGTMTSPLSF